MKQEGARTRTLLEKLFGEKTSCEQEGAKTRTPLKNLLARKLHASDGRRKNHGFLFGPASWYNGRGRPRAENKNREREPRPSKDF